MSEIIEDIMTLKEDKPELYITDEIIKGYIEDNIEILIEEIRREI